MTRRYGRGKRGERLVCKVPHGDWKTSTFIAALRYDRVTALLLLDGPMDGPSFRAYVEQILARTLKRSNIVVMDNVSIHEVAGVREAIEARGTALVYLRPYSPDLNPIELFSRLKVILRKAAQTPSIVSGLSSAPASSYSPARNAQHSWLMQDTVKPIREML